MIAESALHNSCVLVTTNKILAQVVREFNGSAVWIDKHEVGSIEFFNPTNEVTTPPARPTP